MRSCVVQYEVKTEKTEKTTAAGDIWLPSLKDTRREEPSRGCKYVTGEGDLAAHPTTPTVCTSPPAKRPAS